jgi:hypothetical protein
MLPTNMRPAAADGRLDSAVVVGRSTDVDRTSSPTAAGMPPRLGRRVGDAPPPKRDGRPTRRVDSTDYGLWAVMPLPTILTVLLLPGPAVTVLVLPIARAMLLLLVVSTKKSPAITLLVLPIAVALLLLPASLPPRRCRCCRAGWPSCCCHRLLPCGCRCRSRWRCRCCRTLRVRSLRLRLRCHRCQGRRHRRDCPPRLTRRRCRPNWRCRRHRCICCGAGADSHRDAAEGAVTAATVADAVYRQAGALATPAEPSAPTANAPEATAPSTNPPASRAADPARCLLNAALC